MSLVKYHELEAETEGLAYFLPPPDAPDPLGEALRERGGTRAEKELSLRGLAPREAVLRRGYGSKAAYIVATPSPRYDPQTHAGGDEFAASLRACLDAAEAGGLASLCFGSWSLSMPQMPARLAAIITFRTLEEWKRTHRRRTLKKVLLALHDREGYAAFQNIGRMAANGAVVALPNITGEDAVWKVEKVLL